MDTTILKNTAKNAAGHVFVLCEDTYENMPPSTALFVFGDYHGGFVGFKRGVAATSQCAGTKLDVDVCGVLWVLPYYNSLGSAFIEEL